MCDYSIENCKTRDARVGDRLVSGRIRSTDATGWTRSKGFHAEGDDGTAVCLRPGTELAFEGGTAIFRELDGDTDFVHHDALEFPDGSRVKVAWLSPGQTAVVLQLPTTGKQAHAEEGLTVRLPEPLPASA